MMETQTLDCPLCDSSDSLGIATPVLDPAPGSTNHSLRIPKTDPGSNATGILNSTTSANITITPELRTNNVSTVITNASDATSTESENITHSTLSPSQSHPTTPVPTHNGTTHMNQTPSFLSTSVTPTPLSNHSLSQHQNSSDKPLQATALPASSAPTSEPLKAVSATVTPTTTTTTTKSNASSTRSSQNPTTSQLTRNTSQSNRQSTATQLTSQANAHTNNSLPLNGKDTTMDRGSLALDPLLAGLVSAFIIAAVIITLLLFLKLRRRGNRPEFHRLQELPMDDMEDTPLSMYSY
ncbi:cell wall integrity and stress response component 4-like [Archocentrus centrarchus]|uniref:cell wall integrity and stress response component 4-like n=1 Tax=Archocentrus centrarchus TaxID=63155 RepID=UPI0011EA470E|nr:cell wall integrity and stress response component 4-like [Archocentrus centrarchus]